MAFVRLLYLGNKKRTKAIPNIQSSIRTQDLQQGLVRRMTAQPLLGESAAPTHTRVGPLLPSRSPLISGSLGSQPSLGGEFRMKCEELVSDSCPLL